VSIATVVDTAVRSHVGWRVVEIVVELGVAPAQLTLGSRFDALGLDSLHVAELVQILEYDFDVRLFSLAHDRIDTVGDAIDLVVSRLDA
jgi:acyl carrier protein